MGSVKASAFACAGIAAIVGHANAADLPQYLPPPPPPVIQEFSGWYLRGDIGMTNQSVKSLYNVLYNAPGTSIEQTGLGFDSSPLFGVGVGYQFNDWIRADVTGEYRGKANFHGLDIVKGNGGSSTDEYRASKSEWLAMGNVYADLGTWNCFTPFIGFGIGASYNKISNFLDVNTTNNGVAFADDTGKWNFAWAAHAGVGYKVTQNVTLEFAYRYLDLGSAQSGDLKTFNGINNVVNPMEFKNITSHDLKFGVRWMFDAPQTFGPSLPLVRKG